MIESGDLEKYCDPPQECQSLESDNPMETTACEKGFVPEGRGLSAVNLEKRNMGSLPHIAYTVSRPRRSSVAST